MIKDKPGQEWLIRTDKSDDRLFREYCFESIFCLNLDIRRDLFEGINIEQQVTQPIYCHYWWDICGYYVLHDITDI